MGISGILFIIAALCAGLVILQISLSKKNSKLPGLILPVFSLCVSLLSGFVFASASDGDPAARSLGGLSFLLFIFLTAVLTGIYAFYRGKISKRRDLDKMSVQDL